MGTLRRHIILWLLLVPVGLCGQKNTPVTVTCENRFVGRDCVSGDSIPAVLYRFNRRVERMPVLDTVAGRAIVQFRDITKNGKYLEPVGPMISMELSDGAVLWQRDIGYIFGHTWIDEELIVETDLNKSRRIVGKENPPVCASGRLVGSGTESRIGICPEYVDDGREGSGIQSGGRFDALETPAQFPVRMERL